MRVRRNTTGTRLDLAGGHIMSISHQYVALWLRMYRQRLGVVRLHHIQTLVLGTTSLSIIRAELGPNCNGNPITGTAYDTAVEAQ